MNQDRAYTRGVIVGRLVVPALVIFGLGVFVGWGVRGPGAVPGSSASAAQQPSASVVPQPSSSVRVCTLDDYDTSAVLCRRDDARLSDLSAARLQYQVERGTFLKDVCVINITQFNSAGSETTLGSTTEAGQLGYGTSSALLSGEFAAAGVVPTPGTRYRVTVGYSDQANGMTQLLGSATFTYEGS